MLPSVGRIVIVHVWEDGDSGPAEPGIVTATRHTDNTIDVHVFGGDARFLRQVPYCDINATAWATGTTWMWPPRV